MGCDIHIWAEVKTADGWKAVTDRVFPNPDYDPERPSTWSCYDASGENREDHGDDHTSECWATNQPLLSTPYDGRNYDLFAILADVRNGRGFAGVLTGAGFDPIVAPRGVPDDASRFYRAQVARWDGDGHSHSWLTLRELKEYDWHGKSTRVCGVMTPEQYETLRATGTPPASYSGDVWGDMQVTLDTGDYEQIRAAFGFDHPKVREALLAQARKQAERYRREIPDDAQITVNVRGWWPVSYYDCAQQFIEHTIPSLEKLGGFDDVRIVFFFDN